jgi:bis(5'-nucleosidyl)-tetraphosphatase
MPAEHSAGAVIVNINGSPKYLLLHYHYKKDFWDYPKGHIEEGETAEQAAEREVTEETGIKKMKFVPGFREKIKYFFRKEGQLVYKDVIFFIAETKEEHITLSEEHIGFEWLPFDKACEKATFKNTREILKKANDFLIKRQKEGLGNFL